MSRTLASPVLVGREQQLGRLDEALRRAGSGLSGTVLVPGEAGSGKTRLLSEFLAVARAEGDTALSGTCVEVSAGDLPFVPFRNALRPLVQRSSSAELDAALGSTWRDLHVLLPELAPSSDSDRRGASPHVFEVVASVLGGLSRQRPVVLAVDDAQWADQSTLQLLRYLVQPGSPGPLLLVVAYRGEDLPTDPPRRKAFEELSRAADDVVAVGPLDGDQVAELVSGIGIELDAATMRRLTDRSAGLPFLVEELVAAERDGVTRGIPRRLHDVVRLRVGSLSEDAQLVVALVAVAARPLKHRVLADAAHLPARVFAPALSEALTANLLVADTADRTYGFRHDVAREIVHEGLLTTSRLELHMRLAVSLQADLPVDAYASRLCEVAYHWLQTDAHEEHALRAALLAARASTRAYAHPEALRQYEQVLRLWPRVPAPQPIVGCELVELQTEAAEAAHWAGDTQAALRHIDAAITEGTADAAAALRERRALYAWLDSGRLTADPDQVAGTGPPAIGARMRASDLMQRGRYAESVKHAVDAVELSRTAGSWEEEVQAQVILGVGLAMSGRLAEGRPLLYAALEAAGGGQSTELVVSSHINLTFVLLAHDDLAEAAQIAIQGMQEVQRRGIAGSDGALVAVNAAGALTRLGRLREAEEVLVRALDATLPPAVTSVLLLGRAEIEVLSARHEEAQRTLRQVADLAPLENSQFQQQLRAWEAELRLWFQVGGGAAHPDHVLAGLGSDVVGDEGEDLPLTLRLMWLGVRSDADAAARTSPDADGARRRALTLDGTALAARARHLATSTMTGGMRRQVDGYLALIGAEESRLHDLLEPERWKRAAETNDVDPYLRTYALWRQAGALHSLRRRREAVTALREAYDIAEPLGIRVLVEAVTIAGLSLNVRMDEPQQVRLPKARTASPYNLTAKEQEVLALLVRGFTNRRIGSTLRMTEKTASVHVSRILAKLSVGSRGEAVARAYELGLVSLPTGK